MEYVVPFASQFHAEDRCDEVQVHVQHLVLHEGPVHIIVFSVLEAIDGAAEVRAAILQLMLHIAHVKMSARCSPL